MPKRKTKKRKTKKNKTLKLPKNFCKTSLKKKNIQDIRKSTSKLVCENVKKDKSKKCIKKYEKIFDKGYLDKCKEKM